MEKNHYEFFSYNAKTSKENLICKRWCAESEMKSLAMGIALGLHQFRTTARVRVYFCKEDGTRDFVHEVNIVMLRLSHKRGFI